MSEAVAAVLGAIAGVAGTWLLDARRASRERAALLRDEAQRRRHEKAAIATALLCDLRALEVYLRRLYHSTRPLESAGDRPHLYYDHMAGEVRRFTASNVQAVADFFRMSDEVFAAIRDLRQRKDMITPHLQYQTRATAGYALQALPHAKISLENEGGMLPEEPQFEIVSAPDLPAVPGPVFELWARQASGEASDDRRE